jgi:putative transposase
VASDKTITIKHRHDLLETMDGILHITMSGCQWRMLPMEFAPWQTVYYYFRQWKFNVVLEEIHDFIVHKVRLKKGKNPTPTVQQLPMTVNLPNLCVAD